MENVSIVYTEEHCAEDKQLEGIKRSMIQGGGRMPQAPEKTPVCTDTGEGEEKARGRIEMGVQG